jgi:hydroxymethylglutaryl-CoA lyase
MSQPSSIKIIETPRDGLQGIESIIPIKKKIDYINLLLQCGFDTVEVGSFVSEKVIPQMADTAQVIERLDFSETNSRIAVLVANEIGGHQAMKFDVIDDLIFPFSVSETFLKKNINKGFGDGEKVLDALQDLCVKNGKRLLPYLTMGFGNPYGDDWSIDLVVNWVKKFEKKGIEVIPLSDIMGEATPEVIGKTFSSLVSEFPKIEFGLHLHSLHETALEKMDAAYRAGVRRFDTVLGGYGGCPMTGKELVGNLALESLMDWCQKNNIRTGLNIEQIAKAQIFPLL